MTQGRIHSFETFGSVDGPGVRFVVFVQGCRMRCAYCHNPDSWKEDRGELWEPADVLARAMRYRPYWGHQGGITVSGGEPLLQVPFLSELFTLAGQQNVHTVIDTAGEPFSHDEAWLTDFDRLLSVTDLVLLDIKHIDADKHRKLTGKPLAPVLDCARYLAQKQVPVWIRHVLVPGINDDEASLSALHEFILTLPNVQKVEVLPYHNMAVYKWRALGIPYRLEGVLPPGKESISAARKILTITSGEIASASSGS